MENEAQIFTRVDHPVVSRPRKLHHMETEDESSDEEEKGLIKPSNQKAKRKKQLRRRSSLNAELEAFDTFESYNNHRHESYNNKDNKPSESPFFRKNDMATLDSHTNVHSSMSMLSVSTTTNNAITVAPSRNGKVELNVFDTRHHHRRHHHHHRRRRSTTPDPVSQHQHHNGKQQHRAPPQSKEEGLQSLLERLDNRIKNNFGDWTSADDDTNFEYRSMRGVPPPQKHHHTDTSTKGPFNGTMVQQHSNAAAVSLPPLYKSYQTVLKSAKGKLMDRTCIALSKDNNDAKSILSEAKRTLTQMGADRASN